MSDGEVTKHNNPCLENAADDEPIFVLRAQDDLAVESIHRWADLLELYGNAPEKAQQARDIADAMQDWQKENGSKLPD